MTRHLSVDAWISAILPHKLPETCHGQLFNPLELHKRLVNLASLRETALQHLGQLDAIKVALTERKATQQGRLLAALDARLCAAHAAVDPHRSAAWDLVKALEKEAASYTDMLQGLHPSPTTAGWAALTERYERLQQQAAQHHQQSVQPDMLEQSLAAELEQSQAALGNIVQQHHCEVNTLKQQVQQDLQHHTVQDAAQQVELPEHTARQQCLQELACMQQLTALVLQQLQTYHEMQATSQGQVPTCLQAPEPPAQQRLRAGSSSKSQNSRVGRDWTSRLLLECGSLKQQLQQLSQAVDVTLQCCQDSSSMQSQKAAAAAVSHTPDGTQACCDVQPGLELHDPSEEPEPAAEASGQNASVTQEAIQQLRAVLQGPSSCGSSQIQGKLQEVSGVCTQHGSSSQQWHLQAAKLRASYQQMLHTVQSRYQQQLRKLEMKHQEDMVQQVSANQQALADLTKQHQEVCGRLTAAAAAEADSQQQLARLQADKQALQQQVDKLQRDVSEAAASALAVMQVQHEQQMIAVKQEHEHVLQDAREQQQKLEQQLHTLQQEVMQQSVSAAPIKEALAGMLAEASAQQSAQQQLLLQQLEASYQQALQQNDDKRLQVLQELSELRRGLHDESSTVSTTSAATDVTAAAPLAAWRAGAHQLASSTAPSSSAANAHGPLTTVLPRDIQHLLDSCSVLQDMQSASGGAGAVEQQQQQQQPLHEGHLTEDPMETLIAAVLGPGSLSRTHLRDHRDRLSIKQQQLQQERLGDPVGPQLGHAGEQQHKASLEKPVDLQARLDHLLGLRPPANHDTAVTAAGLLGELRQQVVTSTGITERELAPDNAALQTAVERSRVAAICLPALQDISCSSSCNGGVPAGEDAQGTQIHAGGRKAQSSKATRACAALSAETSGQRQWQQWQQQQQPGQGTCNSPRRSSGGGSPAPASRQSSAAQHGQPQELPMLVCQRCGQQDVDQGSPCCFHPGLVAAPGPLLFGQEWHTCRARCTPDMPGCYTRKGHFFGPLDSSKTAAHNAQHCSLKPGKPRAASPSRAGTANSGRGSQTRGTKANATAAAPVASESLSPRQHSCFGRSTGSPRAGSLSPARGVRAGRYVGAAGNDNQAAVARECSTRSSPIRTAAVVSGSGPEPRSNLPQPPRHTRL